MLQGQKLLDIYSKVAEETNTSQVQVIAVVTEFWNSIRDEISNTQGNNILIHHFGSFTIPEKSLPKYMERLEHAYKQGYIDEKKYNKGLKNLKKIQEMIIQKESDDS